MPNFSKGHNSRKQFQNFFKSWSGHLLIKSWSGRLLIIPYQPVKFQGDNFRDILLTRFKCPNFQKTITQKTSFGIFSKVVNQVILLIIPYQHIKFLYNSSNSFWDILLTRFHWIFLQRGITQERGITLIYGSTIFSWQIHKCIWNFKDLACTVQKLCYAKKKCD